MPFHAFLHSLSVAAGLERDVHADGQIGIRAEGHELLRGLSKDVVHADEEVEARGMDVEHPAGAGAEVVDGHVDASVEPLEGRPVGAQAAFSPRVVTVEVVLSEQSEGEGLVDGQLILHAHVGRGGECFAL